MKITVTLLLLLIVQCNLTLESDLIVVYHHNYLHVEEEI